MPLVVVVCWLLVVDQQDSDENATKQPGLCEKQLAKDKRFTHVSCTQVVDQRNSNDYAMRQSEFFKAFRAGGDLVKGSKERLMLKVEDYPPDAAFAEEMPRHWQVSLSCICQAFLHA